MNKLSTRDALFSQLHASVLKVEGFKKRGHWSVRDNGSIIHTVYLRASRWSDKSNAIFWVDVQVFCAAWYELLFAPKKFSGPGEDTPSLISVELGAMCKPSLRSFTIDTSTDASALSEAMSVALRNEALPLFRQCSTLEGVLSYYQTNANPSQDSLSSAGLCLLLNREGEAKEHMQKAKALAAHENDRQWLLLREQIMWSNRTALSSC